MARPSLGDIFGVQDDRPPLSAIFGGDPDFSDVISSASSTADDLLRKKRAQMAQARQLAAAQGLAGPAPAQGVGDRVVALGDRVVAAGGDALASIPELAGKAVEQFLPTGVSYAPDATVYPTIGKPGGFLDMAADRQRIHQQALDARERLLGSQGDPGVVAGVDTLAEAAGMAISIPGLHAARAAEEIPALARAAGLAESVSPEAAAEAAYMARRAKVLPTIPGAREPFVGPGAIADSLRPESKILQVGTHADNAAQDIAVGLRAPDPSEPSLRTLQQKSLQIELPDAISNAFREQGEGDATYLLVEREGRGAPGLSTYETRLFDGQPVERHVYRDRTGNPVGVADLAHSGDGPPQIELLALHPESGQAGGVALSRLGKILADRGATLGPDATVTPQAFSLLTRARESGVGGSVVDRIAQDRPDLLPPRPEFPTLAEIFGDKLSPRPGDSAGGHILPPGEGVDIGNGSMLPQAEPPRAPFSSPPEAPLDSFPPSVEGRNLQSPPPADAVPTLRNMLTREEVPLDTPRTGTMHAITRAEQDAAGLPRTTPAPHVNAWEEARQVFERDPQAPRVLAQEVAAKPRPLSDFEEHLLKHDRAQLKPAYDDALAAEEHALASGDPAQAAAAKLHRLAVERDFQANADAADLGGSQWGKSGNARQVEIGEDYSPLQLVRRYKVANLGEDAPDVVRSKLVDVSRKLEDAQARFAAAEEHAQNLEVQRMVYSEAQNAARDVRSKGRGAVTAGLDQEYSDLSSEWRKSTGLAQAGVNPDQAVILAKMARNRVRAGVTNLQDLVDGIFQDARPHLDTLEPQDVRDAIASAGPLAQKAAKKAVVSDFAALRREARVLNALDGAQAKLAATGDSKAQAVAQKELARWEAELEKIHGGARQAGGPLSDPERIRASLARNATRQAELRDQIASGTIVPKTRAPIADYALLKARAETQALQRQADAIIGKRELQNRSWLQKGLDLTAATARFTPLTSVTGTLPKLASAASWRSLVMRPAEQLLSVADPYLPLLRELGAEAPVEGGGVGLNALKKSYQGFFSREARTEAMAHLRGEEGPLALALGKPHQPSGAPAFMDYPSHLHAALKSPAVVAGYNWAMETQAAAAARIGRAITPELRQTMESNAWEVAMRDILLNDNAAVQRFNLALQKLPEDSTATRVGIAAVRSQLPIVKVATNYPLQATDYLFGLPKFGIRAGKVIYRGTKATAGQEARTLADIVHAGIQASPPGYADQIMRNLKRGRLGAALASLVLTGAVEVGGYYRKGEHRSESDLQPGEIRIGGSDAILQLPHNVLHSPPMEAMQVVGTFKRSKSFSQGLGTSALGLAEQTPFFEESVRIGRDLPNNPAKFAGMAARQISEPPDAQKLARVLDQDRPRSTPQKVGQALGWAGLKVGPLKVPEIKARKRTPHGDFWEQLLEQEMLGIPGLRDNVR